ncbi:unnamed protein product, partial [Discosporangium mesarthrocarpum]
VAVGLRRDGAVADGEGAADSVAALALAWQSTRQAILKEFEQGCPSWEWSDQQPNPGRVGSGGGGLSGGTSDFIHPTEASLSEGSAAAGLLPVRDRFTARLAELQGEEGEAKKAEDLALEGGERAVGARGGRGGGGREPLGRSGGRELTHEDYRTHLKRLRENLSRAWLKEEKVTALKVAVQAAKLMGDTSVPFSYPAVFVHVTDLLEDFALKVFSRIKDKAEECTAEDKDDNQGTSFCQSPPPPPRYPLRKGWTQADVSPAAKETCRNWFYKTACIRELLPRILIEVALLPCYRFLAEEEEYTQILGRLCTVMRGLGDIMLALYSRCYLAVVGVRVCPGSQAIHAATSLQDYLFSFEELREGKAGAYMVAHGLGISEYVHLQVPAIDWLLRCASQGTSREVFTKTLNHYREHCGSLEVLCRIMTRFHAEHYGPLALKMAQLIKQKDGVASRCTKAQAMGVLGRRLAGWPLPSDEALPLLNEAWQVIDPAPLEEYVEGAAAWLEILLTNRAYSPEDV